VTDERPTVEPWVPLSRRDGALGVDDTLYEGVPPHLHRSLIEWVVGLYLAIGAAHSKSFCRVMLQTIQARLGWSDLPEDPRVLQEVELLDLLDALLAFAPKNSFRYMSDYGSNPVSALDGLLELAGSAWRVNSDQDGLERRVDGSIKAAVTTTIQRAGSEASDHLAAAWQAAYGRQPDPDKAYAEAVKAVEAPACQLVLQKKAANGDAVLSDVIGVLNSADGGAKWELLLTDRRDLPVPVDAFVTMLRLLMQGHRSRHSGGPNTRRQTQAEAEAAVHLAATLVQWLSTGVLRKKP
jgi:hypothetical protein